MAKQKDATHVVVHKKLYLAVEGKLQHMKAGTELTLDDKTAEQLGGKIKKIGEGDHIDLTGDKDIAKMNVEELTAALGEAGIEIPDGSKKKDLVALLEGAE